MKSCSKQKIQPLLCTFGGFREEKYGLVGIGSDSFCLATALNIDADVSSLSSDHSSGRPEDRASCVESDMVHNGRVPKVCSRKQHRRKAFVPNNTYRYTYRKVFPAWCNIGILYLNQSISSTSGASFLHFERERGARSTRHQLTRIAIWSIDPIYRTSDGNFRFSKYIVSGSAEQNIIESVVSL